VAREGIDGILALFVVMQLAGLVLVRSLPDSGRAIST